ncbi:tyrosine-type recombinase/integrase [Pseudalkalibacillus sp. R45]|uniref:tyrosine-type recombinase/integrase n=1 Tax=Pseudalkalibacillus sp. R45 TaxID=3457433 RepID=UPI003FCD1046
MKTVEAIKDEEKLQTMKRYLKNKSTRDYCLFLLGINTGIRIHDLLHIKVNELMDEAGSMFTYLQSNLYNAPPVYLNDAVLLALRTCINERDLKHSDFLFKSRKTNEPISRQQAYRIINEASKHAGITGSIGTHTLRKTFGYHAYKKGIAISLIQKRLQHHTPSDTRQYLGLTTQAPKNLQLDVNL